jgi:hypothetical protein
VDEENFAANQGVRFDGVKVDELKSNIDAQAGPNEKEDPRAVNIDRAEA